jgi:hypothetical protein
MPKNNSPSRFAVLGFATDDDDSRYLDQPGVRDAMHENEERGRINHFIFYLLVLPIGLLSCGFVSDWVIKGFRLKNLL